MNFLKEKIKKIPKHIWILALIVIVGIFLRTYNFHDWLTFNPDQARDAFLVIDMVNGKTWPLLGPRAGNTNFKLGPIFYYFEYASAKIFGLSPVSLAYPDLLFSIMTLPLFYFFLKKYFSENLSLSLTFLYSISFFVITYSRFAFNPNSIQFFVLLLLYSLVEILNSKKVENLKWALVAGIAVGVGMQLHALLLVLSLAITFFVFGYLLFKKRFAWKSVLVMIGVILLINTGQIVSEFRTRGANTSSFFKGASADTGSAANSLIKDLIQDTACQIEGNVYIMSSLSLGGGDKCKATNIIEKIKKWGIVKNVIGEMILFVGGIFFLGGYVLLVKFFLRERNQEKKNMLGLLVVFAVLLFLILLPISGGVAIRYYIIEAFMPFILLGFWINFFDSLFKNNRTINIVFTAFAFVFFVICNLLTISKEAIAYTSGRASNVDRVVLGELIPVSDYMINTVGQAGKAYFTGKTSYSDRFFDPLKFLVYKNNIKLSEIKKKPKVYVKDDIIFYIPKMSVKKYKNGDKIMNYVIEDYQKFKNIEILKVRNNM